MKNNMKENIESMNFADLDPFEARKAKLSAMKECGIDPFPAHVPEHKLIKEVRDEAELLVNDVEEDSEEEAKNSRLESLGYRAVTGRITALRGQGALIFSDLRDRTAKIQIIFKKDSLSDDLFAQLALLDLGDFIWVEGKLFITKRGELTIEVANWMVLAKSLRPLPDLWKGLQDIEQKQRQRYADLIANETTRQRFQKRSQFVREIRNFLDQEGFTEVETPVLEHIPGGADAEPFITHHNALDADFYLRISLELHLKRLLVGGFEKIYELGRVFRNEGVSPQHLQEFTMLEFYWGYASYEELMDLVERMYTTVIEKTFGTLQIQRGENVLNFERPWPRVKYVELLEQYAGINVLEATDEELVAAIKKYRVDTDISLGRGRLMDQLYKKTVRPYLIQPQFVVDVPLEFSPLAKKKSDDPRVTERCIVLVDGAEVGNGFSELNDPIDQRERFEVQEKLRLDGDPEAQRMDTDFLRALEYGMPPTTGFGVGVDRLLALLLDLDSIRETVFFPTMRPENSENKE